MFVYFKKENAPLLGIALMFFLSDMALLLLKYGANPNISMETSSGDGDILLMPILLKLDPRVLEAMIKQKVDLNKIIHPDPRQVGGFNLAIRLWHYFCLKGDVELVKITLQQFDMPLYDSDKFSLIELLEPKKYADVQTLYKHYLKQFYTLFKPIEKEFTSLSNETAESLEESAVDPTISAQEFVRLKDIYNRVLMQKQSIIESFKAFEDLFERGGNDNHQKIAQMLQEKKLQSKIKEKPASNDLETINAQPKPLLASYNVTLFKAPDNNKTSDQTSITHQALKQ